MLHPRVAVLSIGVWCAAAGACVDPEVFHGGAGGGQAAGGGAGMTAVGGGGASAGGAPGSGGAGSGRGGSGGGTSVTDAGTAAETSRACGPNVCAAGQYCCNASCGTCVPNGLGCNAVACAPDAGRDLGREVAPAGDGGSCMAGPTSLDVLCGGGRHLYFCMPMTPPAGPPAPGCTLVSTPGDPNADYCCP